MMARLRSLDSTAIVYLVLLVTIVVGAVITAREGRNFFSVGNIDNVLTTTTILGMIAIGQTLVILVGSLDLSVPFVVSLASVTAGGIMAGAVRQHRPRRRSSPLVLALVFGLVNGLIVSHAERPRLHRHPRHRADRLGLSRLELPGQPRLGPAPVPAARRDPHRPGSGRHPDHARVRGAGRA